MKKVIAGLAAVVVLAVAAGLVVFACCRREENYWQIYLEDLQKAGVEIRLNQSFTARAYSIDDLGKLLPVGNMTETALLNTFGEPYGVISHPDQSRDYIYLYPGKSKDIADCNGIGFVAKVQAGDLVDWMVIGTSGKLEIVNSGQLLHLKPEVSLWTMFESLGGPARIFSAEGGEIRCYYVFSQKAGTEINKTAEEKEKIGLKIVFQSGKLSQWEYLNPDSPEYVFIFSK